MCRGRSGLRIVANPKAWHPEFGGHLAFRTKSTPGAAWAADWRERVPSESLAGGT